mgnify:CR=1 FL=1
MLDFVNGEQIHDQIAEVRAELTRAETKFVHVRQLNIYVANYYIRVFLNDHSRPLRLVVVFEDFLKELFSIFSVAEVHIADATIINT